MSFGSVDDDSQRIAREAEDERQKRIREQKDLSRLQVQALKRSQTTSNLGNLFSDVIGG
jgi:hypothetical protein